LQTEPNLPKRGYEPCSFAPDVADALVRHGGIDNRIADRAMAHESLTRPPLIWEFPPRVSTSADWYESLPAAIGGRMMFACLILSRGLSAQLAASGVQTCGRTSIGASRAHSPRALREFRLLLLPTGKRRNHDNIAQPCWVSPRPLSPVGTPQLMAPVLCPGRPGPFFR
jgi:hypothetical protein